MRHQDRRCIVEDLSTIAGIGAAPIVTALVAAIGQAAPRIPRRAYPLLAVALGIGWNVAAALALDEFSALTPLVGVVTGLAASGLYSGAMKPAAAALRREG